MATPSLSIENNVLICLSPAKLNLFLHITGRRADGYHTLQTYFQLLDYGDNLSFESQSRPGIDLKTPLVAVTEQENLIYKAAKLLQQHTGTKLGAKIQLDKKIPLGAGLGGGSSNAGTTLVALNHLWKTCCTPTELQQLSIQLGADVPLFTLGQSAWAEGIGEQLTPLNSIDAWFLVITPNIHVTTQEIFRHPQLTRNTPPITVAAFREGAMRNDCQRLVCALYPEIADVLNWLNAYGQAKLTGTGASCFVSFATLTEAATVQKLVPLRWQSFVARGISETPLHQKILH